MADQQYKRLTRPRRRSNFAVALVSRCSLWMGQDHLLHIDSTGYTETYKRFYFRDIQAVTLMRTHSWIYQMLTFGFLGACALAAALLIGNVVAAWFFGPIAGLFLFGAAYNGIAGPTCLCELRTAVQTEQIPSLYRVWRSRKVLAEIRPLIAQAQGALGPEEIPSLISGMLRSEAPASATVAEGVDTTAMEPGGQLPGA